MPISNGERSARDSRGTLGPGFDKFAATLLTVAGANWKVINDGFAFLAKHLGTLAGMGLDALGAAIEAIADGLKYLWDKLKGLFGAGDDNSTKGAFDRMRKMNYDGGDGGFDPAAVRKASYEVPSTNFTGGVNDNANFGAAGKGDIPLTGGAAARGSGYALGHMNPEFHSRLAAMMRAAKADGVNLSVKSGWRSQAHQNSLFANSDGSGHWVARHSHHTAGIAADLGGDMGWAHRHARQFGLKFPMPWENWHIEPDGSRRSHAGREGLGHRQFSPPTKHHEQPVIENVMVLDGDIVHRSVNRRMLAKAEHSTQAPYHDGHASWTGPDSQFSVG